MEKSMPERNSRRSSVLTVRMSDELALELDMYCSATKESRSDAARSLLREALFAKRESNYAAICRIAVREELNKWLDSARMQKEYAADDFYDRLAAAMSSEMIEIRRLAGAILFSSVTAVEHTGEASKSWDDWYSESLRLAWTMGIEPTLDECRAASFISEGEL